MITFIISIFALILGYVIYGAVVDRIFGPDDRETPAVRLHDGVDYVAMPTWKIFMIQFLNIAGTGPIFGAIMGMWFGPAAFLWIVLGSVFAGAVHDYLSGMLSMRHDGAGLPALVGKYLGGTTRNVMLVFSVLLLLMVGAVFVYSPAIILASIGGNVVMWMAIIFVYYLIATMLPIDKLIGKVYPLFAISLIFMALALMVGLLIKHPHLPELWDMGNMTPWLTSQNIGGSDSLGLVAYLQKNPLFPCMFITIACGAISGFHATQSPLMARCMKDERLGRRVFVAQFAGPDGKTLIQYFSAPTVVKIVCTGWLGIAGGILAMLGVVAAPITSGDTALRSGRLIIAEALGLEQKSIKRRLYIAVPMFVATFLLLMWQLKFPDGFNMLWQYFGWSNQTLSVFTLWTLTVYLALKKKPYIITLIPAIFMTVVCTVFLIVSPQALNLGDAWALPTAVVVAIVAIVWFFVWRRRHA